LREEITSILKQKPTKK